MCPSPPLMKRKRFIQATPSNTILQQKYGQSHDSMAKPMTKLNTRLCQNIQTSISAMISQARRVKPEKPFQSNPIVRSQHQGAKQQLLTSGAKQKTN